MRNFVLVMVLVGLLVGVASAAEVKINFTRDYVQEFYSLPATPEWNDIIDRGASGPYALNDTTGAASGISMTMSSDWYPVPPVGWWIGDNGSSSGVLQPANVTKTGQYIDTTQAGAAISLPITLTGLDASTEYEFVLITSTSLTWLGTAINVGGVEVVGIDSSENSHADGASKAFNATTDATGQIVLELLQFDYSEGGRSGGILINGLIITPEPLTMSMLGIGATMMLIRRRRR